MHTMLCGDSVYICKSCHSKIKKNKVPCHRGWFLKWNYFFHSFDAAVSRFLDEVVCEGWRCWDKVET